jgi:hypothetical protein
MSSSTSRESYAEKRSMVLIAMESLINGEEIKMMKEEFCFLFFSFFTSRLASSTACRFKLSEAIRPSTVFHDR